MCTCTIIMGTDQRDGPSNTVCGVYVACAMRGRWSLITHSCGASHAKVTMRQDAERLVPNTVVVYQVALYNKRSWGTGLVIKGQR